MWNYIEINDRKYRYQNTQWFPARATSHISIIAEYNSKTGWRPLINWESLDKIIKLRNDASDPRTV